MPSCPGQSRPIPSGAARKSGRDARGRAQEACGAGNLNTPGSDCDCLSIALFVVWAATNRQPGGSAFSRGLVIPGSVSRQEGRSICRPRSFGGGFCAASMCDSLLDTGRHRRIGRSDIGRGLIRLATWLGQDGNANTYARRATPAEVRAAGLFGSDGRSRQWQHARPDHRRNSSSPTN
jgi:hypothetical protein